MDKKKILLIDDEQHLCRIMKMNLERTGEFEVRTAHSGREGLELAKAVKFDLVITDFRMPGMDGRAVLSALKKMSPQMPVVLFSIYHDDADTITPEIESKADGIISKPIEHAQLYKTIQQALSKAGNGN